MAYLEAPEVEVVAYSKARKLALEGRVLEILSVAAGRSGHIFNLGYGIVPKTPVDQVLRVVDLIKRHGHTAPRAPHEPTSDWTIRP